ncbi:MAG: hypothetical protein ACLFNN_00380 [Candidatus Paceibacterota bacterium]
MNMISINTTLIFVLLLLVTLSALLLALGSLFMRRKDKVVFSQKLDQLHTKIQSDIKTFVVPNFISLAPNTDDFIQFAIEIWRLEQRITKTKDSLLENQHRSLANSVEKMKRYLDKYDIAIVDYTGQKFNDGLNLDVLSGKVDNGVIIQETVEPTIMYRGQVVRKAKIILPSE